MGPLRTFQGEAGIIGRRRGGVSSARESRRSGAAYRGHVGGPARPGRLRGGARDVVPSADAASRVRPGARAHRARGGAERLPLAPASRPRRGPRVLVLAAAAPAAAGWSRAHASGGRARLDEDPRASRGPRGRAVRHARRGDGAGHARQPPARSRGGGLRGRAPRSFFTAKILLLECSFVEERDRERSKEWKHLHLDEIAERADLFENEVVVLTHLTLRTEADEIRRLVKKRLPARLAVRAVPFLPE